MPLTKPEVVTLLLSVGVVMPNANDPRMNPMMLYKTATRDAVGAAVANATAIIATLGVEFQVAKRLFDYMNGAASEADALANAHLIVVGLGASWDAVLGAPGAATTTLRTTAWALLTMPEKGTLGRFVRSRAAASAMNALTAIAAVAPATQLANLRMMAAICDATIAARPAVNDTDTIRFTGITAQTFPELSVLFGTNPPGTHFAGFPGWGPGDHGSAAANIEGHFRKHVLGISIAPLDYRAEFEEWWRVLNISLPLSEVLSRLAPGQNTADVADYFYGPNPTLSTAYLESFINSRFLERNPDIVTYLRNTYEAAYANFAVVQSRAFQEVLVQSNGLLVFISGYKVVQGLDLFIIGRLANGALGISSAYFTREREAKMTGARSKKVWDLT